MTQTQDCRSIRGRLGWSITIFAVTFTSVCLLDVSGNAMQESPKLGADLTDQQVIDFAKLVLKGIDQEYPNKPSNVMIDASSVQSPRQMHPAFFGSFDWHSAIHGHWMLARLLKLYPDSAIAQDIRATLNEHLTAVNLAKEAEYFRADHNRSFERMYGWAWAFRLIGELESWDDEDAQRWRDHLRPLEDILVERTFDFLPKLTYPIRTGVHPDTAFALGQTLDYAKIVGNSELEALVIGRARDYYLHDQNYNSEYEPSGEDFFSPSLNEADLMRRILPQEEYQVWLLKFLPRLQTGDSSLFRPVEVSDVTDGKIVHLAGLDLSRAWCFRGIASAVSDLDLKQRLLRAADDHAEMGLKYVFSGHYEGEHWLATFALYGLTDVGIEK